MTPGKTLQNKEVREDVKKKELESGKSIPINCVAFSQCEKYAKQFATVDEIGKLTIWDANKGSRHT